MDFAERRQPAVLAWYYVYCGCMALLYVLCVGMGLVFIVFRNEMADRNDPPELFAFMGVMFAVMGVALTALFLAPFFLPHKRWTWVFHLVLIALGFGSLCTLVPCVLLLVWWIKEETRAYFGWDTRPRVPRDEEDEPESSDQRFRRSDYRE